MFSKRPHGNILHRAHFDELCEKFNQQIFKQLRQVTDNFPFKSNFQCNEIESETRNLHIEIVTLGFQFDSRGSFSQRTITSNRRGFHFHEILIDLLEERKFTIDGRDEALHLVLAAVV